MKCKGQRLIPQIYCRNLIFSTGCRNTSKYRPSDSAVKVHRFAYSTMALSQLLCCGNKSGREETVRQRQGTKKKKKIDLFLTFPIFSLNLLFFFLLLLYRQQPNWRQHETLSSSPSPRKRATPSKAFAKGRAYTCTPKPHACRSSPIAHKTRSSRKGSRTAGAKGQGSRERIINQASTYPTNPRPALRTRPLIARSS